MNDSTAYIGLDVHSRTCTMAWMNENGTYQGTSTFETSGPNLRDEVSQIEADRRALTLEEGSLAFWTARALDEVVDRTVVCDPRENSLISQSAHKNDVADAKALARLLRKLSLGERLRKSTNQRMTAGRSSSRRPTTTRTFAISSKN